MGTVSTLVTSQVLPIQYFLTTSGNGTGNHNHNLNYSGAVTDAYYVATVPYDIYTILISITDATTFNYNDFGGIPLGTVVNGVQIAYYNKVANQERLLLSGVAFKYNYEWFEITPKVSISTFSGTAQTLTITFDLVEEYGIPFHLAIGDKIIYRMHDNFTGLVNHTVALRGTQTMS